jgi:ferritin
MLSKTIEAALNTQVATEAASSQAYLAVASWAETQPGLDGVTEFFYKQSDEERVHMLKLIHYINERGGMAIVPALEQPEITYKSLQSVFTRFLKQEVEVSESINQLVGMALDERDFATYNFLQWYVAEQIEEERLARTMNDKLELVGNDKGGIYLFDRDIVMLRKAEARE